MNYSRKMWDGFWENSLNFTQSRQGAKGKSERLGDFA
jgi:hypothetical protein